MSLGLEKQAKKAKSLSDASRMGAASNPNDTEENKIVEGKKLDEQNMKRSTQTMVFKPLGSMAKLIIDSALDYHFKLTSQEDRQMIVKRIQTFGKHWFTGNQEHWEKLSVSDFV